MSNGLDDLAGRRQRRKAPAPKHPRSEHEQQPTLPEAPPASAPEPGPASKAPAESARPPRAQAPKAANRQEPDLPQRSDATRAKRTPSVEAYLDQELMDWLWQIEAAAVARRERSVASPAIRLALRELKKRMTPEQVVDALLAREPDRTGRRGRPQR